MKTRLVALALAASIASHGVRVHAAASGSREQLQAMDNYIYCRRQTPIHDCTARWDAAVKLNGETVMLAVHRTLEQMMVDPSETAGAPEVKKELSQ